MPKLRIVLHIGVQKTGSTAIQDWLALRRDALAARGIALPTSLGDRQNALKRIVGRRGAEPALGLAVELAALPAAITTMILSNENLPVTLRTPDAVAALKALLDPFAAEYRVIVYLRRQDAQRVSQFSSAMRRGRAERQTPLELAPYDYATLLDCWAGVFGRAAMVPRLFAGDVVADFAAAAGLEGIALPPAASAARNASLSVVGQAALGRLAAAAVAAGVDPDQLTRMPAWARVVRHLDAEFAGPGMLPARAEIAGWLAQCAASNERVRAEWFPDRAALFDDDLSAYPEALPPPPHPAAVLEAVLAGAGQLLRAAARDAPAEPRRGNKRQA